MMTREVKAGITVLVILGIALFVLGFFVGAYHNV